MSVHISLSTARQERRASKVSKALLTYETLSGEEIKKIVFENIYPKRLSGKEEASTSKKNLGSALGAIGLRPNTQS